MKQDVAVATLGSHSALQILKGAKDESFRTVAVCRTGHVKPYQAFNVADVIIEISDFAQLRDAMPRLVEENAVFIPHGSLVSSDQDLDLSHITCMYFGNKEILRWESNRDLQREWLLKAGLRLPKIFSTPESIDKSVITKFYGAEGGRGYFVANNPKDFLMKIAPYSDRKYVIQEYIVGVPIYLHYFYSPILNRLEFLGCDKRYESNVDSLGRISARDQIALENVDPSYVIVGNIPLVLRESFLSEALEMGEKVVAESRNFTKKGLFGPFCLETIITPEKEFFVFEISARIVAGTNPYVQGSPYSQILFNEPMSCGRRIAREIHMALEQNKLEQVLG